MSDSDRFRIELLNAIQAQDGDAFELAVTSTFVAGLPHDLADVFAKALLMPWHTRHEDLASGLQTMKDPGTVEALFAAATAEHPYLDYDEFFGLARKCTWALADIGTPLARQKLAELAANPNPTIAEYAQKRLDRWEAEAHRKGS